MITKPSHKPTDEMRETVSMHATVGTRQDVIADLLDIDPKTLRKHYRRELDLATAQANASIGGELFNKAKSGDTTAMIFWMKTRAGWKDGREPEADSTAPLREPLVLVKATGK
jgi:hypothetical protein